VLAVTSDLNGLRYFFGMNYEFAAERWQTSADEVDWERSLILRSAVDKLIRFGEQVGVSPEEMLVLLDSGMTVRGLLYYLVSQSSPVN
jgi:hypothetical protein